jgi:uncharacterized protein YraI
MKTLATRAHLGTRSLAAMSLLLALSGCYAAGDDAPLASENIEGALETGGTVDQITARYAAGTKLQTTANLNLRSGASTSHSVVIVMPNASTVTLVDGPSNGWYRVRYGAYTGWAYGAYLKVAPSQPSTGGSTGGGSTGGSTGGSSAVDNAITRARSGVGFSYWWGHGRWLSSGATSSNAGSCRGNCPSCSHSGSYGADCSGYVGKIWQVPSSNSNLSTDSHPYSTYNFYNETGGGAWARINRSNLRRGDALVYNANGAGHIFLYESGDAWGSMWAYEARGCSAGIVRNLRTAASNYVAIRRSGY